MLQLKPKTVRAQRTNRIDKSVLLLALKPLKAGSLGVVVYTAMTLSSIGGMPVGVVSACFVATALIKATSATVLIGTTALKLLPRSCVFCKTQVPVLWARQYHLHQQTRR